MNPSGPSPIATPPISRPTAHEMRTATSVRLGPLRSTSKPHTKLIAIATSVSDKRTSTVLLSDNPKTFTVTTLMTTMTVLTASE